MESNFIINLFKKLLSKISRKDKKLLKIYPILVFRARHLKFSGSVPDMISKKKFATIKKKELYNQHFFKVLKSFL